MENKDAEGDPSRADLAHEASARIGNSLDIVRTAQDLVDLLVPALGDMAVVQLADSVLAGDEPPLTYREGRLRMRQVAVKNTHGPWPRRLVQPGRRLPPIPDRPEFDVAVQSGSALTYSPEDAAALLGHDPALVAALVPEDLRQSLGTPLFARGIALGYVLVFRTRDPRSFAEADIRLLGELATRTALAVDNARRFTREHRTAVTLQHSLLPPTSTDTAAAETAGAYLAADGAVSVGGDWFDALPLSSLRIALVMGDVIGHGLQAAATMARLRTAVLTLSDLDLSPEEVLIRLDDLVQRIAAEAENPDVVGASCLYAVYDPVTRVCRMASAGHPPPVVVFPDRTLRCVPLAPGPVLGVGGMPFAVTEVRLPPGSVLALYTDGLTGLGGNEQDLLDHLATACRSGHGLAEMGRDLVRMAPGAPDPADDVTVLLARTRAVPAEHTAVWTLSGDPAGVSRAREAVCRRLADWGLHALAPATELIVSELVTNAIRHGSDPTATGIRLRLIRDRVLVCEVSDGSNTQPRLREAGTTDENGRGLFLVARLCTRWGSRYGTRGKTIWTEQPIEGVGGS